jgi:uncharacterized protein YndB with AHSA1/START domain
MGVRVDHRSFVIERTLPGSLGHAFRFWSDPVLKRRWTSCHPDWLVLEDWLDFRPGGGEHSRWRRPDGLEMTMTAHYLEIAPRDRIVYAYGMAVAGTPGSSSLVTVEFTPVDGTTLMTFTEQAVFATRGDGDTRESGTGIGFDRLVAVMAADPQPDGIV